MAFILDKDYVAKLRSHHSILNNKWECLQNLDAKIAALTENEADLKHDADETNKYQLDIYFANRRGVKMLYAVELTTANFGA